MRVNGLILGGGIIGSAVAYELSRKGVTDLHVVDADLEGGLSSTERNAGGVRHLFQQPINTELSRVSIAFYEKIKEQIGFNQSGYLWMFSEKDRAMGTEVLAQTKRRGLSYEALSVSEVTKRYPFLDKTDDLAFGLFGNKDGLLNANALKNYYRTEAKDNGVKFHDRTWINGVTSGKKTGETKVVVATTALEAHGDVESHLKEPEHRAARGNNDWECNFAVLCTGAWSRPLLAPLVKDPLVQPIRRQICLFKAEGFDMTPYGMIVDTSHVYFHPEGGNILAGLVLKEEKPGYRFDLDSDFFETHIWPALYERSSSLERLKPVTGWGGLYSYTPDTAGILGELKSLPGLYEAHSFTGRGVMQSYGVALCTAELILEGKYQTISAACLSRERFECGDSALLPEHLHI